jgi:hypothetical protein
LLDERVNGFDDPALLFARQGAHGFEGALHLADGSWSLSERAASAIDEQILDADVQDTSEFGEEIGAGRLFAPFPEGDVGVGDGECASELDLGEALGFAKCEQPSALRGSRPFSCFG